MTAPSGSKKISIFISFSGEGGVERMITNLIKEFVQQGYAIDLLLIKAQGEHLKHLPPEVNIIKLGSDHTALTLWPLVRYLKQHRPKAILVAKHRAIMTALMARKIANTPTRIVGRLGTNISRALKGKSALRKWFWHLQMRKLYPLAEKIIPVSEGVLEDIISITQQTTETLQVIRNPVITTEMQTLAKAPVDHPWLADNSQPVILGAGRFTKQKDFITLIKAFAQVRQQKPCRLILLGAGNLQGKYEQLANELGIQDDLSLPGFTRNPYAYMSKVSLFVLSSAWEGSPNVLTEALAVGAPVVSTNCPSGPFETLQNGLYGPLVPVGDSDAMAQAILDTLDNPLPTEALTKAVEEYTAEKSAKRYLQALGME